MIWQSSTQKAPPPPTPGAEGTPLYGVYRYVRPKGYGFSAALVLNRVWFAL